MCLIFQFRCRCGHAGQIQTRCAANPGRGFTPRCRAHGVRFTGRGPLAEASHEAGRHPGWADRTKARCPRCRADVFLWGVGREMEELGMNARGGRRRSGAGRSVRWA